MNATIFDYGAGNLHSLRKALELGGAVVRVETDPLALLDADALVLPGVGAFAPAAARLAPGIHALRAALQSGVPCLGICLGMQLLMQGSEEGVGGGLGIFRGTVRLLATRRVPHMGWNRVEARPDPLFYGLDAPSAYFANSYVCVLDDGGDEIAWTIHEHVRFPAAIRSGNTWGVQFHPEKSGADGLRVIGNFLRAAAAARGGAVQELP